MNLVEKRFGILQHLALLVAGVLCSCESDNIVYPEPDESKLTDYISWSELTQSGITAISDSNNIKIKAESSNKWEISWENDETNNWCSVSPTEGMGHTQVIFSFNENLYDVPRSSNAVITYLPSNDTQIIPISQEAAETEITTSVSEVKLGLVSSEASFDIFSNTDWEISFVRNNDPNSPDYTVDWCELSWDNTEDGLSEGSNDNKVTISVDDNLTKEEFAAMLMVRSRNNSDVYKFIKVTQAGVFDTPILKLNEGVESILSWDTIIGATNYKLSVFDSTTNSLLSERDLGSATSYTITGEEYGEDNFIGAVRWEVVASAGEITSKPSEQSELSMHSHFDKTSGDGTPESPYVIGKICHLNNIPTAMSASYKQNADLDFANIEFTPIANSFDAETTIYAGEFTGRYDGNGHKISNIEVYQTASQYVGLFAMIGVSGEVSNVTMDNISITAKQNFGAIAGKNDGTIRDCKITSGNLQVGAISTMILNVGGVTGISSGSVIGCSNYATINKKTSDSQGNHIAGIVGTLKPNGVIEGCSNYGNVYGNAHIGGICGKVLGDTNSESMPTRITSCYNSADIDADDGGNRGAGGIVGGVQNITLTIDRCANDGLISGSGSIGGIVGRSDALQSWSVITISNCYNAGEVNNNEGPINSAVTSYAAGIISNYSAANATAGATIKLINCYNRGNILSKYADTDPRRSSGLVHYGKDLNFEYSAEGCYALDSDNTRQQELNCLKSGYSNVSASAISNQSTYTNWDFTTIWQMTDGFPTLRDVK